MHKINPFIILMLSLTMSGCWWWHGPHHGGGSGGTGGAGGTGGSSGSGGSVLVCGPDDQFLLVTEEISGDCGPIDDDIVTPSSEGWFDPSFNQPCVVEDCHIVCDRSFDSATFDVEQTLDLMLGDETFDSPMTISQVDTGANPYSCESDYLIDVTRVSGSLRVIKGAERFSVMNPEAP